MVCTSDPSSRSVRTAQWCPPAAAAQSGETSQHSALMSAAASTSSLTTSPLPCASSTQASCSGDMRSRFFSRSSGSPSPASRSSSCTISCRPESAAIVSTLSLLLSTASTASPVAISLRQRVRSPRVTPLCSGVRPRSSRANARPRYACSPCSRAASTSACIAPSSASGSLSMRLSLSPAQTSACDGVCRSARAVLLAARISTSIASLSQACCEIRATSCSTHTVSSTGSSRCCGAALPFGRCSDLSAAQGRGPPQLSTLSSSNGPAKSWAAASGCFLAYAFMNGSTSASRRPRDSHEMGTVILRARCDIGHPR
eukprot:scaffold19750_cov69-Phaeocystis_antarctica.AAC.2